MKPCLPLLFLCMLYSSFNDSFNVYTVLLHYITAYLEYYYLLSLLEFYIAKMSVNQMRQLCHNMKDAVFGESTFGIGYNTAELTNRLKDLFKDMKMSAETYPRYV